MSIEIRTAVEDDREQLHDLSQQAFMATHAPWNDDAAEIDRAAIPLDRRWVAAVGDVIAGKTSVWPLGQHVGGRSVPMGGLAGVAVRPEHRGSGIASRLIGAAIEDMRTRGEVISTLYPMNHELYRGLGWGSAGEHPVHRWEIEALTRLPKPARAVLVRPTTAEDLPALVAINDAVAEPGRLSYQAEFATMRLLGRTGKQEGYVAEIDGKVTGALTLAKEPARDDAEFFGLTVRHLSALDHDTELALWRIVAGHYPAARTVSVVGPLKSLMPHAVTRRATKSLDGGFVWMTRLVDATAAVAARGYGRDVEAEVALRITDRHAPWNAGNHLLRVAAGEAELTPIGDPPADGTVSLDISALSSIYMGWSDPRYLLRWGLLSGPPAAAASLAEVFAGPTPWCPDFF